MTLAVLHIRDEILTHIRLARVRVRQFLPEHLDDRLHDFDIPFLIVPADIVRLEERRLVNDKINCAAVVLHIEPVAHIHAVPVDRELPAVQRIIDHERDQLLRELIRPVIIGAVRDIRRKMIGVHVRLHQEIRACLRGRIRAVRRIGRRLIEERARIIRERAVHLVRRDVQEPLSRLIVAERIRPVRKTPGLLRAVQHIRRAEHIGPDKQLRLQNGTVHVGLRGKMHDDVDVILREHPADRVLVADIRLHKGVVRQIFHRSQIFRIAGVCQRIHVDDPDIVSVGPEHMVDEVTADKAAASRH